MSDYLGRVTARANTVPPKEVTPEFYEWAMAAADDRDELLTRLTGGVMSDRLRAAFTELTEHGDLTPAGKRVLNNILDGES